MAKKKDNKQNKKKGTLGFKGFVFAIGFLLSAALFLPTTAFLAFGMLPTMAAYFADRKGGWRWVTVGAMNLAGCTPFLLHLWTKHNTVGYALTLITDPRAVIVIFAAAAIGLLIEWAMSGIVVTIMTQSAKMRLTEIDKRMKRLKERWGEEVAGMMPLDEYGFPLKESDADAASEKKQP